MADSIEFQLRLQDQMTASLRSGAENALKLDQALTKLVASLDKVGKEEEKEKEKEKGMFEGGLVKAELIKDAIEKVAEKIFDLGRELVEATIEVTDFGYKAEVALRHLNGEVEGSSEKTNKMLAEAKQFALDAALPLKDVQESFLGLKRAGLTDEWVRPLTAAAGDLAALSGHPERFRELVDVFENISLKGQVTGRSLLSLTQAGVSPAALAAKLGASSFRELQKQLEHKPLGALEGLRAIEEVILQTAHEKTLGDVLKEDSSTIGGSITKIKDVWDILLENLNTSDTFKGLRTDFGELVDHFIERLPELEAQFAATFGPIIKAVDSFISNPDAIKHVFDGAVSAIQTVASIIAPVISGLEFIAGHKDLARDAGAAAIGGMVAGPAGAALAGGTVAYGQARSASMDALQQGGYSQREASQFTGHTFADGGPVTETGQSLVHEGEFVIPVGGALVSRGSGGGGGGSVHAPITVNVHVEGGGMDEQGLKLLLEEMLPGALVSPIEKLAATVGAM